MPTCSLAHYLAPSYYQVLPAIQLLVPASAYHRAPAHDPASAHRPAPAHDLGTAHDPAPAVQLLLTITVPSLLLLFPLDCACGGGLDSRLGVSAFQ
jgi:hypothetical protein